MAKTWDEMTSTEKIENLRRDVVRLFDAYNDLDRHLKAGSAYLGQIATIASEIESLKARLLAEEAE
jgi:phage host-nuclease inhibitor protein Gam